MLVSVHSQSYTLAASAAAGEVATYMFLHTSSIRPHTVPRFLVYSPLFIYFEFTKKTKVELRSYSVAAPLISKQNTLMGEACFE